MLDSRHSSNVHGHFKKEWAKLDEEMQRIVPFYDQSIRMILDIIRHTTDQVRLVVDLGIGTGRLAGELLNDFPAANLIGVDFVQDYIETARSRLTSYGDQVKLVCEDVSQFGIPESVDVVVSAFVFHHLENPVKQRLYRDIHAALRPGGLFINADFIGSPNRLFDEVFDEMRIALMKEQGVSDREIATMYIDHRALEIPVAVDTQLAWLRDTGFSDTECFWKYLNLAVFGGVR